MNKFFEKSEYGVFYHNDGIKKYTQEEVDEINAQIYKDENEALKEVIADGYIGFPVFSRLTKTGELVEGTFYLHPDFEPSNTPGFLERHNMHYNIYVPSFKRAGTSPTIEMLKQFHVENWYVSVYPTQYKDYKKYYDKKHIIVRDPSFRSVEKLNLMSSILSPDNFHGTAGSYNALLALSKSLGEKYYWTIDDDIMGLAMKAYKGDTADTLENGYIKDNYFRCSNIEEKYGFSYQDFMRGMEEIMMKMRNPGFVGMEKFGLVFNLPIKWRKTRVYSYYLTKNETQFEHFGQHNNDVIASLEHSKHGRVNMIFEGIYYNSKPTQSGGGLTDVYAKFGTLDKGKVLIRSQPNYSKISITYNRIHHKVDYNKYINQRLVGNVKNE